MTWSWAACERTTAIWPRSIMSRSWECSRPWTFSRHGNVNAVTAGSDWRDGSTNGCTRTTAMISRSMPVVPRRSNARQSSNRGFSCDVRRGLARRGRHLRPVEALGRQREDLDPALRHRDGVLELGGERAVARHRGPAVGEHLHVRAAEIDHRLDREEHAWAQHDAFAGPANMHDVGLVVKQAAEPMAAEVAHHA